jgi:hypothetical protein
VPATSSRICFHGRKIKRSHVFAGQNVGVTPVDEAHLARHLHAVRFELADSTG